MLSCFADAHYTDKRECADNSVRKSQRLGTEGSGQTIPNDSAMERTVQELVGNANYEFVSAFDMVGDSLLLADGYVDIFSVFPLQYTHSAYARYRRLIATYSIVHYLRFQSSTILSSG